MPAILEREQDLTVMSALLGQSDKYIPRARVSVGGRIKKAVPSFNSWRWDYDTFLNLCYPGDVTQDAVFDPSGKFILRIGDQVHKSYVLSTGELEHEIWYDKKPVDNEFDVRILSNNLVFTKQGEFGEFNGIPSRPDVFGSYVIYHDSLRNNKYGPGKFGELRRPWVRAADGKFAYCDMFIEGDILHIVQPAEFMENAIYPVCYGPIIGYPIEGALTFSNSDFTLYWEMGEATVTGPVIALRGYILTGAVNFKIGVAKTSEIAPNYYASNQDIVSQGEGAALGSGIISNCSVANVENLILGNHYRVAVTLQNVGSYIKGDNLTTKSYRRERTSVTDIYASEVQKRILANQSASPSTLSIWLVNEAPPVIATPPQIFGEVL